jgi:hypothetical protein
MENDDTDCWETDQMECHAVHKKKADTKTTHISCLGVVKKFNPSLPIPCQTVCEFENDGVS